MSNTFYVTMPKDGKLVVREARFNKFICRPCEIYGRSQYGLMTIMDSRTCKFELVVAGVDTIYKDWYDVKNSNVMLYKTKNGAMSGNNRDLLYNYDSNYFDMSWLGLTFQDMISDFAPFATAKQDTTMCGVHYWMHCYAWDGVKPCVIAASWGYTYDIINRRVYINYGNIDLKKGVKYYPTYQACKDDNKVEVFEFDDDKQDKVQVRFSFRVESYIEGKNMDEVRRKWESMDMGKGIKFVELVSVEDAETYDDLTNEIV